MNAVWPHLPSLAGRHSAVRRVACGIAASRRRGLRARAGGELDDAVLRRRHAVAGVATGPISYHLGGWAPPWGIEYRVDMLNGFVLLLVSAVGAVIMPFARRSVAFEIDRGAAGLVLLHVPAVPRRACSASR